MSCGSRLNTPAPPPYLGCKQLLVQHHVFCWFQAWSLVVLFGWLVLLPKFTGEAAYFIGSFYNTVGGTWSHDNHYGVKRATRTGGNPRFWSGPVGKALAPSSLRMMSHTTTQTSNAEIEHFWVSKVMAICGSTKGKQVEQQKLWPLVGSHICYTISSAVVACLFYKLLTKLVGYTTGMWEVVDMVVSRSTSK